MQNQHKVQMLILKELLFNPNARFTDLNISGLTSDHFSYHVGKLIGGNYIRRSQNGYLLTNKGKEFANTMDTESLAIEKQAKIAVLVIAFKREKKKDFLLIQTRLKEPYYGFKGFITGKARFGETVLEAAKREFFEETGLSVNLAHRYIVHEHVYSSERGDLLEDKFFHVFQATNPKGDLIDTLAGKNEWVLESDFAKVVPRFYDEEDLLRCCRRPKRKFIEKRYFVEKF